MPPVEYPSVNLFAISSIIALVVTVLVVLMLAVAAPRVRGAIYAAITLAGIGTALALAVAQSGEDPVSTFSGSWRSDTLSLFLTFVILTSGILAVLISDSWLRLHNVGQAEFYTVLLCSLVGMITVVSATDLMTLFVGIELMSVPTYLLTGFAKHEQRSNEGAMKYFLLGAFSSAILLYGFTWAFGLSGSTNLARIAEFTANGGGDARTAFLLAILLIIAGLSFKVAAVPFHMWTPDAYQGAPTVVTAYMSVAVKAAGFGALVRLMTEAFPGMYREWGIVLVVLSVLTMLLGNVVAIVQDDVKRMLAYSSVGHTGFMLVGLAVWSPENRLAVASVLFYAFAYVFANLGAFGVLAWMENHGGGTTLDHMNGLFGRAPAAAGALAIFLLGLMGFPLTVGLPAKIFLVQATIEANYLWLGIVLVLLSALAAVFYLRVMFRMFMYEPRYALASPSQPLMVIGLVASVVGTVGLGVFFSPVWEYAQRAAGA